MADTVQSHVINKIIENIQNQGFSIQEFIFEKPDLLTFQKEVLNAYHNISFEKPHLREAGVGRNANLQKSIRGDRILWLEANDLTPTQQKFWDFLEELKQGLNQNLFFSLKDFEMHMTVYPKGAFYKKHVDQFRETKFLAKMRKVSFILYLNENWSNSDGGHLNIYNQEDQLIFSMSPEFGRMIFFLSEDFPHEVLETNRERISMTGWFFR